MTEVAYDILTGYYDCLNGNVSVPVYKESALTGGNYVLLRIESETPIQNNSAFMKNPVILVEVVTEQQNSANPSTAWGIMNTIGGLIFDSPGEHNITVTGFQLYGIEEAGTQVVQEEDSVPRIYRIIKRFLNQTIK